MYVKALWQLLRPRTYAVLSVHYFLALGLSAITFEPISIGLGLAYIALWYIHAVAINDLSDERVDAINFRSDEAVADRPLINRTLNTRQLRYVIGCVGLAMIVVATCIDIRLAIASFGFICLNVVYSLPPWRISARGLFAQLLLPLGYVGVPFAAAIAGGGRYDIMTIIAGVGLYIIFVGRLLLKDIRDEKGDRKTKKYTYLVRHGLRKTLVVSGALLSIGVIAMLPILVVHVTIAVIVAMLFDGIALWALWRCLQSTTLDLKLLYIAIVGRSLSGWVFYCLVHVWLEYYDVGNPHYYFIVVLTVMMFLFGIQIQREAIVESKS